MFFFNLTDKIFDQTGKVFLSLAERRNCNSDRINPVEQIFSEDSLFNLCFKIFIGGRNQTDIQINRLIASNSFNRFIFNDP